MRGSDRVSYIVAALCVGSMIASVPLLMRHSDRPLEPARRPKTEPKTVPMPSPETPEETTTTYGGDELAPFPEKVPPVPMPAWPGGPVSPRPTSSSEVPGAGPSTIDKKAAVRALKSVPYKDCGTGGPGKVSVTFAPSGAASIAVVTSGEYDGGTKSCIQNRFRGARVPPFEGSAKAFGWSISL